MEGIKVYLSDGTFKSVFISGNETVGQITSKILTKLSQQLDIDTSKYWLFEATKGSRESEHRRLGKNMIRARFIPKILSTQNLLVNDPTTEVDRIFAAT
jgi:hypothetical protein